MPIDYIDNLPMGFIAINEHDEVIDCNRLALKYFEIELEQISNQNLWTALPELSSTSYRPVHSAIKQNKPVEIEIYYSRLNKWFELIIRPGQTQVHLYFRDISDQHAIKLEKKLFQAVFQSSADAVVITDNCGTILMANQATEELFGFSKAELLKKNIMVLMNPSDGKHHDHYMNRYLKSGDSGIIGVGPRELVARHKEGRQLEIELAVSEFHSDDKYYFVGSMRDITERKELQRKLEQMAGHDALTGLANRSLLFDRASQSIAFSSRNKHILALLFIDLDGFKRVNDQYGHKAGDQLITVMAARMTNSLRASDTVARIGGDEFVVLLNNIQQRDNALVCANNILSQLNKPVEIQSNSITISGSIGIASYPADGADFEVLLNNADKAMYQAKEAGKNQIIICHEPD